MSGDAEHKVLPLDAPVIFAELVIPALFVHRVFRRLGYMVKGDRIVRRVFIQQIEEFLPVHMQACCAGMIPDRDSVRVAEFEAGEPAQDEIVYL